MVRDVVRSFVRFKPLNQKRINSMDPRDEFIRRVVAGESFADVGGLWGTLGEKISVAAKAGAASLTMIDIMDLQHELWTKFRDRHYQCISGDICQFGFQPDAPSYDVVHCSGVLYHHPSPMLIVEALRRITKKYLILSSAITQETIRNSQGTYTVPPSGVVFIPALNDRERRILAKYWNDKAGITSCAGITEPIRWDTSASGPWWTLPTATAVNAMATCCRFRVIDSGLSWNNNTHTVLLETVN